MLVACSKDDDPGPEDSCPFARDGVCDEPVNCALGTDTRDCAAACASGAPTYLFAAACAHRSPPPRSVLYPDAIASQGSGGRRGHYDGTIEVPSGSGEGAVAAREFRVYVPQTYDPAQAWPLVVNMPGHRVDHRDLAGATQLMRSAALNRFLLVFAGQEYRQGRWAWWTDWDWANKKASNPDLLFLRRLVEHMATHYNLDRSRVMLSGHSRGAAMALIGALELTDLVAGAAVESGFTEYNYLDTVQAAPARRPGLVFVHGIQDPDVCIDCRPGRTCAVSGRTCNPGVHATDALVERLCALGWQEGVDLLYYRLDNVTHRWQDPLNEQWWGFLSARPLPREAMP